MKRNCLAVTASILLFLLWTTIVTAATYSDWDLYEQQVFELVNVQRDHHGLSDLTADSRLQTAADLHSQDMAQNDFFSHTSLDGTRFSERISAQQYDWNRCGENIAAGYTTPYSVMYGTNNLQSLSEFDIELGHDGFSDWDEVGQDWSDGDWDDWADADGSGGGGWMGSSGHRANILYAYYTDIGVGYYYLASDTGNSSYYHYWTQDFAAGDTVEDPAETPLPAAIWILGSGLVGLAGFRRHSRF